MQASPADSWYEPDGRGYPRLSVPLAPHALALARDTRLDAFGTTPSDTAAPHPELWRMTAAVMADRNAHEAVHYAADIATAWGTVRPGGPA